MSIAWPSLREVRGHLQTLLCLSFCWLPLEGNAWDWAKLDLLSEFLFFCSILAAFFSCQLRRFSFDDYIDNISSSMLERLCSKLWPHLCRRPCVTWVSDNAGGQKLVFRQQILQEDVLWEAWHVEATSWQPKVQIFALIQDNVDELDRLARTSLCVSQGLEFGCGKCCWFASPKNDPDLYYHLQSLKSTTSFSEASPQQWTLVFSKLLENDLLDYVREFSPAARMRTLAVIAFLTLADA